MYRARFPRYGVFAASILLSSGFVFSPCGQARVQAVTDSTKSPAEPSTAPTSGNDSGPADTGDMPDTRIDPAADRRAIVAHYAVMDTAFLARDLDTLLDDAHDQDFQAMDRNANSMDLKGVHDALFDLFDVSKAMKITTKVRSVAFKGNTASVDVYRHLELKLVDPNTSENSVMTIDNYSHDFWTKDVDVWTVKRSRVTSSVRRVVGKPPAIRVTTW